MKRKTTPSSVYVLLEATLDENRQLREKLRRLKQNVEAAIAALSKIDAGWLVPGYDEHLERLRRTLEDAR